MSVQGNDETKHTKLHQGATLPQPGTEPNGSERGFTANNESEIYGTVKTLRRPRHLELLVFELLGCLEELWDSEALFNTASYERARELYKALAHNRRPDGSKY